jgi:hypothetical protein
MRSLDLLSPEQKDAIARFFWNLAIAELPRDSTREAIINLAIKIGKSFRLVAEDFYWINNDD